MRPTLGAPLEQTIGRPQAEQGRVDRNNRPEAEDGATVTAQARSAAVPSTSGALSIGTASSSSSGVSQPPTTRGHKSVSHGGSAIRSKRTLLRPSFNVVVPTATVSRPTRIRAQTTSGQTSQQRNQAVPTPSPFVLTGTSERRSFISPEEILTRAGVTPFGLTRAEATRSEETPGVAWIDICRVFGGSLRAEWVECRKIPGYKTFLCADVRAQPYMPTRTGKPGLILCPPTITPSEDDNITFHVLLCSPQDNQLYYQGEYTKVPLHQIQVSFCDLPAACRQLWIKRVRKAHAAIRARIKLRNEHDREPSAARVQEYLRRHPTAPATHGEVSDAFRVGEEKLLCYGIRCTAYDSGLATIIQRLSSSSSDND